MPVARSIWRALIRRSVRRRRNCSMMGLAGRAVPRAPSRWVMSPCIWINHKAESEYRPTTPTFTLWDFMRRRPHGEPSLVCVLRDCSGHHARATLHQPFLVRSVGLARLRLQRTVSEVAALQRGGKAIIAPSPSGNWNTYAASDAGVRRGEQILRNELGWEAGEYIQKISMWVRSLGFSKLVKSIYEAYPKMKANSIFRG
jgi:hypothetical protein